MDFKTNPYMFLVIMSCMFLKTHLSLGADIISTNQSLSGDQTIISAGGKFELGFFKPGRSSNYYIGMWYRRDPSRTVLWVANREKPVADSHSSALRISDGNLVLFDESEIPVWSTNVKSTATFSSVQAILLHDGNLVLQGISVSSTKLLWKSFNYLTDTFLHGSKLGYNNITKTKKRLTSWKNSEDPSPGHFSFELDPSDDSLILLSKSSRKSYWSSGPWKGESFSLVPEMKFNRLCYFNFVSNVNESYVKHVLTDSSIIAQFRLDVSGQIKQRLWLPTTGWNLVWSTPRDQCEVYAFCGAYGSCNEKSLPFCNCLPEFKPRSWRDWELQDYSGGCVRKAKLRCGEYSVVDDGEKDRFLAIPSVSLPEQKQSVLVDTMADCDSTCLNNCSCTAYASDGNSCSIWMGDLLNLQQLGEGDSSGRTLHIRLAASEFKNKKGLIIGVVVGSVTGLSIFLGLLVFLILRRRRKRVGVRKALVGSLLVFGYKDLQRATKNFSDKLGQGGFGSVFKGVLPDSTVIAVKKLESVGQGEKEFRAEVSTIGAIQHVNLVRLFGFCSQGSRRLLVYDYMSNGSLSSHLFHSTKSYVLDWNARYQIAIGTARGLFYLHEKCRDCIIHCDIKPENILLDAEFHPKIADFGLAKLMGREFSRVLTTIRGTRGYLAPEWITGDTITSKADVYSYGMMLFEFVSGRRNSEEYESGEKVEFFPSLAAGVVVEGGNVLTLLDPRLDGNVEIQEVERVCKVACWCIQDEEAHRPSMGQVVQFLEGIIEVNLPPVPRSFNFYDHFQDNVIFFPK